MELQDLIWSETVDAHIARHQVNRHEVSEVVFSRGRLALRARAGVIQIFGQIDSGRYLKVIVKDHGDGTGFVVTALDMKDSERPLFKRRKKG